MLLLVAFFILVHPSGVSGVQSAEPDLKGSQVTVKGVFDPAALVEHVHRRTGRHAAVVKAEPVAATAPENGQDNAAGAGDGETDKAAAGGGEAEKAAGGGEVENAKKKEAGGGDGAAENDGGAAGKAAVVTKNAYNYYHPRYQVEYAYPPQIFSDENPNACAVM